MTVQAGACRFARLGRLFEISQIGGIILLALLVQPALAGDCAVPLSLGNSPDRLIVVVPATGQGPEQWSSFLEALKRDPQRESLAWLVIEHGVSFTTIGHAREVADAISSCIQEKAVSNGYKHITLIGHSIGGMLARQAYLENAGAFPNSVPPPDSWAARVDDILLFASVNRGLRPNAKWWGPEAHWLLRNIPHAHLVLEDLEFGSDFIADVRIAWIRCFGTTHRSPPRVVQFWGTEDSVVTDKDNADLEAFSGPVLEKISGATHSDLQRFEGEFTADPRARWALIRRHLFDTSQPDARPSYSPRRVLFIVHGIRDSSRSEWVNDLAERAGQVYGKNVDEIEYGYFSAAQFAVRPIRSKMIPRFRDLYAEHLARNPLTTFDFIGHSNGTYILGQSLLTTPSMQFENVVLAAPVLPVEFDWSTLFQRNQVKSVRYDTSTLDWPVGVLCPLLRAVGFTDVGPSGLVRFGDRTSIVDSRVQCVGWHKGGHGGALSLSNRAHLLSFAEGGADTLADPATASELGFMRGLSRATPYLVWLGLISLVIWLFRLYRRGMRLTVRRVAWASIVVFAVYALLDII